MGPPGIPSSALRHPAVRLAALAPREVCVALLGMLALPAPSRGTAKIIQMPSQCRAAPQPGGVGLG